MYYSRTDRRERRCPAERPFAYKGMPKKYWHVFGETAPPASVAHRSAIGALDDNGEAYARELLGSPRGDRRRVQARPPRPAVRPVEVPKDPAARKKVRDKALAEVARLEAELAKLKGEMK